ncbi:MAG: hypothetical protein CMO80_22250 [Verrucomicrobiales bacterium]|nr:hypothetical protein [Verrucomicrobiales bacterium]|tara:strand:+ start:41210 stop:41569 length:360 start_codon:yes stop_codon:yes gene_type:complete
MQEFFTRQLANEGKELPLYLPSGEKSEHKIRVLGVDSDKFKSKEAESKKIAAELAALDDNEERRVAIEDLQLKLIATLVIGWTFDQECTEENVVNFLREAPQIADAINRFAGNRKAFFS